MRMSGGPLGYQRETSLSPNADKEKFLGADLVLPEQGFIIPAARIISIKFHGRVVYKV